MTDVKVFFFHFHYVQEKIYRCIMYIDAKRVWIEKKQSENIKRNKFLVKSNEK